MVLKTRRVSIYYRDAYVWKRHDNMRGQQQFGYTSDSTLRQQGGTGEDGHTHLADWTLTVPTIEIISGSIKQLFLGQQHTVWFFFSSFYFCLLVFFLFCLFVCSLGNWFLCFIFSQRPEVTLCGYFCLLVCFFVCLFVLWVIDFFVLFSLNVLR